ncbi:EamA family transporter RarD [Sansalvadorimonas verongulae]|uniref:EamA family transporter RarD n=1 Tax=Sansalvadorimonas verongulae TaxID=2172824 RepID=UPI0018AD21BB|nr:EamA family transporter RarD [Sansalvadorimonas verongulae]
MSSSPSADISNQTTRALLSGLVAFTLWGISPVYFKQVAYLDPIEVLAHRVIWSFIMLTVIVLLMGQLDITQRIFKNPKLLLKLIVSSLLIGVNWLTFIWAITNNQIVEISLGYYLNPIVSVILAMIFLKENLSRLQWLAVGLASLGVLWQIVTLGRLPMVSITLALSFGLYGLIRKTIAPPVVPGLLVEKLVMLPLALGWVFWLYSQGESSFSLNAPSTMGWLILAGVITLAPLLLFTSAAPHLRLTTLGFLQYIGPSISLCLGVMLYKEPFGQSIQISFAFIWLALVFFSADASLQKRKA